MTPSHVVRQISPMFPAANMRETLQFYTEVLGFSISMDFPEYAIVERDGYTVHFMPAADQSVMDSVQGHLEFYLQVSNIHSLWPHVQTFEGRYKMRGLLERDYGMTEFHLVDPNGCLIFVGEPTADLTKNPTTTPVASS